MYLIKDNKLLWFNNKIIHFNLQLVFKLKKIVKGNKTETSIMKVTKVKLLN